MKYLTYTASVGLWFGLHLCARSSLLLLLVAICIRGAACLGVDAASERVALATTGPLSTPLEGHVGPFSVAVGVGQDRRTVLGYTYDVDAALEGGLDLSRARSAGDEEVYDE